MADHPNPALRAELLAALDVVIPQVRGLQDFAKTSLSDTTLNAVKTQIEVRSRRADLIQKVLNALDAVTVARATLEADGYPALPRAEVFAAIAKEIQEQKDDLAIAAGIFDPQPVAADLNINLGSPVSKIP